MRRQQTVCLENFFFASSPKFQETDIENDEKKTVELFPLNYHSHKMFTMTGMKSFTSFKVGGDITISIITHT